MKIILHNGSQIYPIPALVNANIRDGINGEFTLGFTLYGDESFLVDENTVIEYDGQFFKLADENRYQTGKLPACDFSCEHVSYSLNERVDNRIEYSGDIAGMLNIIFSGTSFTVGIIESDYMFEEIAVHGNTYKRSVLYNAAAVSGCEVEYDGYVINLIKHRGSVQYINLLGTDNVIDVRKRRNVVSNVISYDIELGRRTVLKAGDNIKIIYAPLKINDETRIIGIDYNPYNPFEVSIDVGDYVPDILDSFEKVEKEAAEANEAASELDERLTETEASVEGVENELKETVKKSEVDASINTYINSEAGTASIVLACSGKYATVDSIKGFKSETEVRAIISSEVNQTGGSIKMFVEGKNYITQTTADGIYLKSVELNAGIASYVDTSAGTAKIVSACSGTYQVKGDYVSSTTLNTEIGQYIDTSAGTAKIVSACSATYQTKSGMSSYATTASITQEVSNQIAAITLTVSTTTSSNQTTSTIAMKSGYTTISSTTIVGTTATQAATIAASAVNGITLSVSNGTASSTLTLKNGTTTIASGEIKITGMVTFSDLSGSGTTVINGSLIKTGTINANNVSIINLNASSITSGTINANLIDTSSIRVQQVYTPSYTTVITSSGNNIIIGGSSTSSASAYITYVYAIDYVRVGGVGSYVSFDPSGYITPSNVYWDIGKSGSPFRNIYTQNLYVNGSPVISESAVKRLYASTSNYVEYNSSSQLVPNGSYAYLGSSSYKWNTAYITTVESTTVNATTANITNLNITTFYADSVLPSTGYGSRYLGNSSYYWQYAYLGSTSVILGSSTSSRVGFFGASGNTKQSIASLSSTATLTQVIDKVNDILAKLRGYGLIS